MGLLGFVRAAKMLNAVTTTTSSESYRSKNELRSFQALGSTSAGAGSATIIIEVNNEDNADTWLTLGTITLTLGTTATADGFTTEAPWLYTRARVSAISGTGATVTVYMSYQDK